MAVKDASVTIRVAENRMKAFASYLPFGEEGKPLTVDEVMSKLGDKGVKSGIKVDIIEKMVESDRPMPAVVVAEATPPGVGEKAKIESYVKPNDRTKAVQREDGTVDYKDLGEVSAVDTGQKLFRKIPPTIGAPGIDIIGKEIPGLLGKDMQIVTGHGTAIDSNDENLVIASLSGEVLLKKGIMEIAEVHQVKGDVDYETGNVSFKGSVIINGTVKSGFKVEADGDIEIRMNVEDAEVIGKNDVVILGGCAGSGEGKIQAGRDILVKFVENQTLTAERDIIIQKESYHANLFAGRSILAKGFKSMIVGGKCEATNSIESAKLGSVACAPTKLIIGVNPKLNDRIKNTFSEIEKVKETQDKIEKSLIFLYKLKIDGKGKLKPDKAKLLARLEMVKKTLPVKIVNLENLKEKLKEEMKDVKKSFVISNTAVFPKVEVHIGNQRLVIQDKCGPSQFRLVQGEVARLSK